MLMHESASLMMQSVTEGVIPCVAGARNFAGQLLKFVMAPSLQRREEGSQSLAAPTELTMVSRSLVGNRT